MKFDVKVIEHVRSRTSRESRVESQKSRLPLRLILQLRATHLRFELSTLNSRLSTGFEASRLQSPSELRANLSPRPRLRVRAGTGRILPPAGASEKKRVCAGGKPAATAPSRKNLALPWTAISHESSVSAHWRPTISCNSGDCGPNSSISPATTIRRRAPGHARSVSSMHSMACGFEL